MRGMIKYETYATVEINHEYYPNNNIPLALFPDVETRLLLAKYNIIFRKLLNNQWLLLKPEEMAGDTVDFTLRFELQVIAEDFYYSTADFKNEPNSSFHLKEGLKPNLWKMLEIPFRAGMVADDTHIRLQLSAKHKYFEYILIPKYTLDRNINLKLTEDRGMIFFNGPERVTLFKETEVVRFISKDLISLRKVCAYKIRLWEIRSTGERLLSGYMPCPKATDISTIQPQDTISTYYYF